MAFHFTAVNRVFMDIPGGWQFTGPDFAVSAWIWREDNSTNDMVFGKYPGQGLQRIRFSVNNSNQLSIGVNWNVQYRTDAGGTVAFAGWRHVGWSGDGTSGFYSINGSITTVSAADAGINDSSAVAPALGGADDNGEYFNGWLAEVAIWDDGITQNQMQALALGANPMKVRPTSLIGYWPLRGTSIPMADLSGNGRHLTEHNSDAGQYTDPAKHPPVQFSFV